MEWRLEVTTEVAVELPWVDASRGSRTAGSIQRGFRRWIYNTCSGSRVPSSQIVWVSSVFKVGLRKGDNAHTPFYLFSRFNTLWSTLLSLLGNANYFFFSCHLLDVAISFKTLATIVQSVTHNGKQVGHTLLHSNSLAHHVVVWCRSCLTSCFTDPSIMWRWLVWWDSNCFEAYFGLTIRLNHFDMWLTLKSNYFC